MIVSINETHWQASSGVLQVESRKVFLYEILHPFVMSTFNLNIDCTQFLSAQMEKTISESFRVSWTGMQLKAD